LVEFFGGGYEVLVLLVDCFWCFASRMMICYLSRNSVRNIVVMAMKLIGVFCLVRCCNSMLIISVFSYVVILVGYSAIGRC